MKKNDFSIHEEIKVVSTETFGVKLEVEQINELTDKVLNSDLLDIISFHVQKEIRKYLKENKIEYDDSDIKDDFHFLEYISYNPKF